MSRLTDRELLRLVREHLDLEGLLAAHPEVSRADIEALWKRCGVADAARPPELFDQGPPGRSSGLKLIARCDGAARGNPGPAAIGVVIADSAGEPLLEIGEAIGPTTCNVAEYTAVIRAAEQALALGASELILFLDSELLVFQLRGTYKVKAPHLRPLHRRATELLARIGRWDVRHVPREENTEADRLANEALDARGRGN